MGQTNLVIPSHVPEELVDDWAFDTAPGINSNPAGAMDKLRRGPDIIYAPMGRRGRGTWVIKKYDLILEAFQKPEIFSSDRYSGFSQLLGEDWPMIPLEVDPPAHKDYRALLNKVFSPRQMAMLETGIRETSVHLIEEILKRRECEFQSAFGRPLPTTVFLKLMGLPLEHADQFLEWEQGLVHGSTLVDRADAALAIKNYLVNILEEREKSPTGDVVSFIATAELAGRPLNAIEKLGIGFVLYGAGLDTVASALGFTFKYLAENPDRQEELRNDPEMRAKSLDEFLRANSMVVAGRTVARDIEFHGVKMKQGDFVSLPTMFANRDPDRFEGPAEVDFARKNISRHISFGSGPHTCLGAHLARREIKIVLDEWLKRVPPFRIAAGDDPVTYGGSVFGVDYLPLSW